MSLGSSVRQHRPFDVREWLADVAHRLDPLLRQALDEAGDVPPELADALAHGLLGGGKRLRPALCLASAEAVGGPEGAEKARPAAVACELIHAYSLIHDDLPAMDDDELRRGEPTVHVAFGQADAILAGDALQTLAFQVLAGASDVRPDRVTRAVGTLAAAAGAAGMVGGQHLDMRAASQTVSDLEDLARRKTACLITAACVTGGVLAGATAEEEAVLRAYGQRTGLAFQVTDDLLDVVAEPSALGKATAKDAASGKVTFPGLLGVEGAQHRAEELVAEAIEACAPLGEAARPLVAVARYVVERTH